MSDLKHIKVLNQPLPKTLKRKKSYYDGKQPTASSFHQQSLFKRDSNVCGFCSKPGHRTENCYSYLSLTKPDRLDGLRRCGLCFRCLKSGSNGHKFNTCTTVANIIRGPTTKHVA